MSYFPSINIYLPVYYGTSDEVLEKGLGLVETEKQSEKDNGGSSDVSEKH